MINLIKTPVRAPARPTETATWPAATHLKHLLFGILLSSLLAGCNWVDSKGTDDNSRGSANRGAGQVLTHDATLAAEAQGRARVVRLQEDTTQVILPALAAQLSADRWNWRGPIKSGALQDCQELEAFDASQSADRLENACTDSLACQLGIRASSASESPGFEITTPVLMAHVGLTYQLKSDQGDLVEYVSLCAIARNEAPVARDDHYTLNTTSPSISITAGSGYGLLANDSDDAHIGNQPLRVMTDTLVLPAHASKFEISADGSFHYVADGSGQPDGFSYQITDGTHTDNALVYLEYAAHNRPPILDRTIPDLQILTGIELSADEARYDLRPYFHDPDGNVLSFTAEGLPPSRNLVINRDGRLQGKPTDSDIGSWTISLTASDGEYRTSAVFILTIHDRSSGNLNRAPVLSAIADQHLRAGDDLTLQIEATDEDGDELHFSLTDSESFVFISSTGRLRVNDAPAGTWPVTVVVSDGQLTDQQRFDLVVTRRANRPPVVDDIPNRTFSGSFRYDISEYFSDPDGDSLTFTATWLPDDVTLSREGLLRGVGSRDNQGKYLISITADDGHGGQVSDRFRLTLKKP